MNFGKYKRAKQKRIKETELLMTGIQGQLGKPMEGNSNIRMTRSQTHQLVNTYEQQKKKGRFFSYMYI